MPRSHGGAALQVFPLNLPGFNGLNKQARGSLLGPEWATRLENSVIDTSNRIAARNGWLDQTATPHSGTIKQITEFNNAGVFELIGVTDALAMVKSVNGGSTWTVVTNTATVTDANMQFVIFRNKLLGLQATGTIIIYTGTNFTNLAAASEPQGGLGVAAFGRLWVKKDATSLRYCALLNEADWTGTDAGTFDLTSVWKGQDVISAIAEFNGSLVIFSQRSIIIYTDGSGSKLGMNPIQAYVSDTLSGIGCIARDSVTNVKGDLWFLDSTGVHSLSRLVQTGTDNPLTNLSANVQDELKGFVAVSTAAAIRAVYSPKDRFYLLSLPAGSGTTETGATFCFDTRGYLQDGSARCTGIWSQLVPLAYSVRDTSLDLIMVRRQSVGRVGKYSGFLDGASTYVMQYESGWTNLDQETLKMLKRVGGLFFIQALTSVTFKWAFDFDETFSTGTVIYPASGTIAEWGTAEWGTGQWGGGVTIKDKHVGGTGTGKYIKIGFSVSINSSTIACQQVSLYAKQGRPT